MPGTAGWQPPSLATGRPGGAPPRHCASSNWTSNVVCFRQSRMCTCDFSKALRSAISCVALGGPPRPCVVGGGSKKGAGRFRSGPDQGWAGSGSGRFRGGPGQGRGWAGSGAGLRENRPLPTPRIGAARPAARRRGPAADRPGGSSRAHGGGDSEAGGDSEPTRRGVGSCASVCLLTLPPSPDPHPRLSVLQTIIPAAPRRHDSPPPGRDGRVHGRAQGTGPPDGWGGTGWDED